MRLKNKALIVCLFTLTLLQIACNADEDMLIEKGFFLGNCLKDTMTVELHPPASFIEKQLDSSSRDFSVLHFFEKNNEQIIFYDTQFKEIIEIIEITNSFRDTVSRSIKFKIPQNSCAHFEIFHGFTIIINGKRHVIKEGDTMFKMKYFYEERRKKGDTYECYYGNFGCDETEIGEIVPEILRY